MSYSVTVIHWTYKKNARQLYPLKILVTVNRVPAFLPTDHKVTPGQWDKEMREVKDHPNAKAINANLRRLVAEKEAELLKASDTGEKLTPELVKGKKRDRTLFGFAKEVAKKIKDKDGNVQIDPLMMTELNRIDAYKGSGLLLTDIDVTWLRKYNDHEKARGMAPNTRHSTFKRLRKVFKLAKAERLIRENPFDTFTVPEYQETDTVYLVEEEKSALFQLLDQVRGEPIYTTLVYFLFACYAGPRHSDWRKFHEQEMVYKGFLRLRPKKKSRGFVVMPVGKTLTELLQRIKDLNEPPYKITQSIEHLKDIFALAEVHLNGKVIKGIKKRATTHVARHSFGYLCASLGLPKSTTAELMGISVKTVEVYYHLTGENIIKQAAILKEV